MKKKLKLLSNGKDMYPNIALLSAKPITRRFIGWRYKTVNYEGDERVQLVLTDQPETVEYHNDYVKAVKKGELIAYDAETAQLCGVAHFATKE